MINLNNKIILLTGAAGLLGMQFSKHLIKSGAKVIMVDKVNLTKKKIMKQLDYENSNYFDYYRVDLTKESEISKLEKKIFKKYKFINVLINNAAFKPKGFFNSFEDYDLTTWNEVFKCNVTSAFLMSQKFYKLLSVKKNSSIINMCSIYALVGPNAEIYKGSFFKKLNSKISSPVAYTVTKIAIHGLTKFLSTYLSNKKNKIRTNSISPGGIYTGQNKKFVKLYSSKVPLKRMGEFSDLNDVLCFMCSDGSKYINGQNIVVDGGYISW